MKLTQYRPTFFEGFENWEGEVSTIPELTSVEFIARWPSTPFFHRFSLHRNYHKESSTHLLLAEFKDGTEWWVVAKLQGTDLEPFKALPEWEAKS